ncbi:c-type cytochrome [Legionella spiritensis]|uniref:c-type cytochrome n=1 Tax=Legionella spiritensis TaxID=452 RepID=UPI000F6B5259|nr:c-type cytochrome [Legionella spiritensis]VEG90447.1 cytochrome c5 [Legionella spiritensis]
MYFVISVWLLALPTFFFNTAALAATHNPETFLAKIKGSKDEGQQIVKEFCATCHAPKPLIELGAPKAQATNDWQPRIKKGLKQLLANTSEGINAMPPRGGCFECTDEQLELAILALLPKALLLDKK